MDKETIEYIEGMTVAGEPVGAADFPAVIIPNNCSIQSLEQFREHRDRFQGQFMTQSIEEFCKYVNQIGKAVIFIDPLTMNAHAFFDMGNQLEPGHCKHRALIDMERSEDWKNLENHLNQPLSQRDLAEFMEDYGYAIKCFNSGGGQMSHVASIAAIRRLTIEQSRSYESTIKDYKESKSSMEEIEAKSGYEELPATMEFTDVMYYGLDQVTVRARISLLAGNPERGVHPQFTLRAIDMHSARDTCADDFEDRIREGCKDVEAVIYQGKFKVL